ncbi:hypothetical protein BpHYR1_014426 [Brachionus plicatilis]|uniref:Uncharacterized protein n=1 Tax=Brachionus plicatilis TaxID=10195 RepID=A0A3M7SJS2_BRAPC|nr:hypothetical protein BpHYR1_014426 [Brachionus plicatilis]
MSSIACHGPANAIRGHKKRLFVQLSNCPARTTELHLPGTTSRPRQSTLHPLTASRPASTYILPARTPPPPKPQRPTMAKLVRRLGHSPEASTLGLGGLSSNTHRPTFLLAKRTTSHHSDSKGSPFKKCRSIFKTEADVSELFCSDLKTH